MQEAVTVVTEGPHVSESFHRDVNLTLLTA